MHHGAHQQCECKGKQKVKVLFFVDDYDVVIELGHSMPHCSKCGKVPPLGIKRLFKAVFKLIQQSFHAISQMFMKGKRRVLR